MAPPKVEEKKIYQLPLELPKPELPPVSADPLPAENTFFRQAEFYLYGSQQKNRLEQYQANGLFGLSVSRDIRDVRLAQATIRANDAYQQTFTAEKNALLDPSLSANPPRNMVEVTQRSEAAYVESLRQIGLKPSDIRGISVAKAADFLRTYANMNGDFTTLSPAVIRQRIANNQPTNYFVRVLDQTHLDRTGINAQFSRDKSPHTWVATPEELAGARLDTYETMRRVGYSDSYIDWIKGEVAAGRKNLSDFVLAITEADGTSGEIAPSWDVLLDRARNHSDFSVYQTKPDSFWREVQNLDYRTALASYNSGDKDVFLKSLTPDQRDVFNARQQMDWILGVNEFFTNDGRTARTDGLNETYGVREFLIDNTEIQSMRRTTFVELSETGKTNLATTDRALEIPDNLRSLRSETRTGALIGGTFSAVNSLPQIFDQTRNGDYLGATQTLVTNTAVGTGTGAFSSASEKIVGDRLANVFSRSATFQNGLDRLYTNGAARNFISRTVQTEASTLTSSTFNSTVRSLAGRIGGAGIVGGVVNGAFSAYDQIGAYNRGEVTASQAIGTVTGEAAVGVGAGLAGAAAGAAIGSIIPGAGTIVGGVIGFGVGMVAGYFADKGLRGLGVNTAIAQGVTSLIDGGAEVTNSVSNGISNAADSVENFANDIGGAISGGLRSIFD